MSVTLLGTQERLCTAEELIQFPEDVRFELIEGNLVAMAPTGDDHGAYTLDLTIEIGGFVRQHKLGRCYAAETGFLIAREPDTVLAPDFAFIAAPRLTFGRIKSFVPIVPDLVLETRSPSESGPEISAKIRRWLTAGVRMILDLSPTQQTIIVHRPGELPETLRVDDTLQGYDILPGFVLPLSLIFQA